MLGIRSFDKPGLPRFWCGQTTEHIKLLNFIRYLIRHIFGWGVHPELWKFTGDTTSIYKRNISYLFHICCHGSHDSLHTPHNFPLYHHSGDFRATGDPKWQDYHPSTPIDLLLQCQSYPRISFRHPPALRARQENLILQSPQLKSVQHLRLYSWN